MKQNNYEQMRNQMRGHFLSYDQGEMLRKFSLKSDEDYLYIRFCGRDYRIGRGSGIVEWSLDQFKDCMEADYDESMTIYDILCCSRPDCCLSGEFSPSSSLKGTVYTGQNAGSSIISPRTANYFNDNANWLAQACLALGGVPEGIGDVAYRIPLFNFLPVRFSFWQADEDFPPEIRLLWDTNVLSFMHYETLWFAAGHMLRWMEDWMRSEIAKEIEKQEI